MFTLAVGLLLILCLIFVVVWRLKHPLKKQPLNVDDHLPLPWLAQTSTVFSLTALFGAYLGVAVTLGLPALLGLAFGTVLGLFAVRYWILRTLSEVEKKEKSFEDFLTAILHPQKMHATSYALMIAVVQCAYAASELLILRELAKAALGLKSGPATLVAICVGVVGYFYVLLGGYLALFRTDLIQLGLVGLMALASSIVLVVRHSQIGWTIGKLWPRPGFWEMANAGPSRWVYIYHFAIATVMGLGLLLASPDAWKRVYQVNRSQKKWSSFTRNLTFVAVGVLPYLVLLPFAITIGTKADLTIKQDFKLPMTLYSNWFYGAVALGLVASFLSSFNGALLGGVHVVLIWQRRVWPHRRKPKPKKPLPEQARFYVAIVVLFTLICMIFLTALALICDPAPDKINNPWMLGNVLMGGYAAIGGIQIGTGGKISRLPRFGLEVVLMLAMVFWVTYFLSSPGYSARPTVFSVNTIPVGVAFSLGTALVARFLVLFFGDRENVR